MTSQRIAALFCLLLWALVVATGCRGKTAPERTYERFLAALADQDKTQAWTLLSQASQQSWQRMATRHGLASGKALFVSGAMMGNRELRPNPKKPPVVRKGRAILSFFDELNQSVQIELRKESKGWRVHLGGQFLHKVHPKALAAPRRAKAPTTPREKAPRLAPKKPPTAPPSTRPHRRTKRPVPRP